MTDKTIPVDVEWALQGKTLGRAGFQVLACSNGHLSQEDFSELIGRFSPGTLANLPQVSVSYLTSGIGRGRVHYLGMAIHKWAADVHTIGGELPERDDDNRPVVVTRYFCVPYQPLADAALSHWALYEMFDDLLLSTTGGPLLRVNFPARSEPPVIDALAMQSAGRLLTGRPVCVLGAESATMAERLAFIDAVASLLPYGFRTRLAATTWLRSAQRDDRFRLFFSDDARDADQPYDVVYWGNPERTALTPRDGYAYAYGRWLADTGGPLDTLARLTTPRSFNSKEVFESLDELGLSEPPEAHEPGSPSPPSPPEPESYSAAPPPEPTSRSLASRFMPSGGKLNIDQVLRDCVAYLKSQRMVDLNTAAGRLKSQARSRISPEDRVRYQLFIKEQFLFRRIEGFDKTEKKLREALLRVAFITPLTYPDYCLIEDSTGAESPDQPLLRLIEDAGMSDTDMRIRSVVYAQLQDAAIGQKLYHWYMSAQVTAPYMINMVAGQWHRPRHAFYASAITADLMERMNCDPSLIRKILQHHSYLARLLENVGAGRDNKQVSILSTFLKSAYPNRLFEKDIRQVLIDNAERPSPALLVAVLLHLAHPEDAQRAREAYVFRMTQAMNLHSETHQALRPLLAFADGQPGDSAWNHDSGLESPYGIEPYG
jgi:hypothetical protein